MLKVLLVGHVCCPGLGSEPGVTWRWASSLAVHNEVWVICHPQYREPTEAYLAQHPVANLHFQYVNLPSWRDPWKSTQSGKGLRFHYLLWQREMLREALRLHKRENFDLAHQVSWTTVTAATPLWKMPIPALWGPVGGAITTPDNFLSYFGSHQWSERLRTFRVKALPYFPGIRRAARNLAVSFATNQETIEFLRQAGAQDVRFLTDQGLPEEELRNTPAAELAGHRLELLWAGRLEHRKALPIVIEALALLPKDFAVRVRVAGEGQLEAEWKAMAKSMGVDDKIEFVGYIKGDGMRALIDDVHGLLFSSLRDAFGTVVMEAMTGGRPVLTLDHQGIGSAVPGTAAIKIPVTTPAETVRAYAAGIQRMANPELRERLSLETRRFMQEQGWRKRAEDMTNCYVQVCAARRVSAAERTHAEARVSPS